MYILILIIDSGQSVQSWKESLDHELKQYAIRYKASKHEFLVAINGMINVFLNIKYNEKWKVKLWLKSSCEKIVTFFLS